MRTSVGENQRRATALVEAAAKRHIEQGFVFVAVGSDLSLLASQSAAVAKLYGRSG